MRLARSRLRFTIATGFVCSATSAAARGCRNQTTWTLRAQDLRGRGAPLNLFGDACGDSCALRDRGEAA